MKKWTCLCATLFLVQALWLDLSLHSRQIDENVQAAPAANRTAITVAIVDTGIDLNHLAFKSSLVKGMNLLNYAAKPSDDNGHGTHVAGVILNTYESFKQLLPNSMPLRIMPIKALTKEGDGTYAKLAEGVRYAVEAKADVIVLSLGLDENRAELEKAVLDAERAGITVVAASGNDGGEVKFPAAYPTVLAVGGVDEEERVVPESNIGDEIDVVAPWKVYTTAEGGEYVFIEGTSMAAPQVAAAAALYLNRVPTATPLQVRQQIRLTAKDLWPLGVDRESGAGLLRIPRLLSQTSSTDPFEPNNVRAEAKSLRIGESISARMNGNKDRDWFTLNLPVNGTVRWQLQRQPGFATSMQMNVYPGDNRPAQSYPLSVDRAASITLQKGVHFIELRMPSGDNRTLSYVLSNQFNVYRDDFEDNDRQYKSFVLPFRSQTIVATLHRANDEDWFMLQSPRANKLNILVRPKHPRFDLVLRVQKRNDKLFTFDRTAYGANESLNNYSVDSGKYYIGISNADGSAVPGEYELVITNLADGTSPNEPNDRPSQATRLKTSVPYFGKLGPTSDTDYYQFSLSAESLFSLKLNDTQLDRNLKVLLLDSRANFIPWTQSGKSGTDFLFMRVLAKGNYYVRLLQLENDRNFAYSMVANTVPLVSGYTDISRHWARPAIVNLTKNKILLGDGEYQFAPERAITRAESSALLVRAFALNQIGDVPFRDVKNDYWAYDEIAKAFAGKVINGYPDNTFQPQRTLSRAEASIMLAKALKLPLGTTRRAPYPDVPANQFAANAISQLKAKDVFRGLTNDGRFQPRKPTTRAEFAVMLDAALSKF